MVLDIFYWHTYILVLPLGQHFYLGSECYNLWCIIANYYRITIKRPRCGWWIFRLLRQRIPATDNIYHRMGKIYVPRDATGLPCIRWLHSEVRWNNKGYPRQVKIVDDTLLYDPSIEGSFYHTFDFWSHCAKNGIVLNRDKFQFCQETVLFGGLQITPSGVTPSESMLEAILNFLIPKTLTDAKSWFGLVNQVTWAYSLGPVVRSC